MNIGFALRYIREEHSITQSELARQTGISQQNISRWEAGSIMPTIIQCVKLADFYSCTIDELIGRKI